MPLFGWLIAGAIVLASLLWGFSGRLRKPAATRPRDWRPGTWRIQASEPGTSTAAAVYLEAPGAQAQAIAELLAEQLGLPHWRALSLVERAPIQLPACNDLADARQLRDLIEAEGAAARIVEGDLLGAYDIVLEAPGSDAAFATRIVSEALGVATDSAHEAVTGAPALVARVPRLEMERIKRTLREQGEHVRLG